MPVQLNGQDQLSSFGDVEEGVFTPQLGDQSLDGTGECQTYTTQVGTYTKIGRTVTFQVRLKMSAVGNLATRCNVLGLPFVSDSTVGGNIAISVGFGGGMAITAGEVVHAFVNPNTSYVQLELWDETTGSTVLSPAELSDDGEFVLGGFYYV